MGDLSSNERKTGVLFGFFQQLLTVASKFETNKIVFCFDSSKSYRKKIYPEYKNNRKKELTKGEVAALSNLYSQMDDLRVTILPALGFKNIFISTGYEADDLIAYTRDQNMETVCPFIIVGSDNDLLQLITYDCKVWDGKSLVDFDAMSSRIDGLAPVLWREIKAMAGCPGDNVVGIAGVGEKSAVKYLKGTLDSKKYDDIKNDLTKGGGIIRGNRELVYLPFRGSKTPDCRIRMDKLFVKKDWIGIFADYDFISFLQKEKFSKFVETFKLK